MTSSILVVMLAVGIGVALIAIAGGIVLLVVGSRRRDDSSSRPFLAFGVVLLIVGTIMLVPTLLAVGRMVLGMG